jgi:hypothetical protein
MWAKIKGSLKSKTVWFAAVVAGVLPYTQDLIGYASGIDPKAGAYVGVAMVLLRAMTSKPLSEK